MLTGVLSLLPTYPCPFFLSPFLRCFPTNGTLEQARWIVKDELEIFQLNIFNIRHPWHSCNIQSEIARVVTSAWRHHMRHLRCNISHENCELLFSEAELWRNKASISLERSACAVTVTSKCSLSSPGCQRVHDRARRHDRHDRQKMRTIRSYTESERSPTTHGKALWHVVCTFA